MKAYLTRKETEHGEDNWDVVGEFPLPWVGRFLLSPFRYDHYPADRMAPAIFRGDGTGSPCQSGGVSHDGQKLGPR